MSVFVDEPVKPGWLELRPFIQTGHLLAAVGLVGRNFRYLREFAGAGGDPRRGRRALCAAVQRDPG